MTFNHYARLRRIIATQAPGWYIVRIDQPTQAYNFKGELRRFDHYYRLHGADNSPIKYGKFQQLDRLASALGVDVGGLPVSELPSGN